MLQMLWMGNVERNQFWCIMKSEIVWYQYMFVTLGGGRIVPESGVSFGHWIIVILAKQKCVLEFFLPVGDCSTYINK